jgi:hypothetical protein
VTLENPISRSLRAGLLHARSTRAMGWPTNCSFSFGFSGFCVFLDGFGWFGQFSMELFLFLLFIFLNFFYSDSKIVEI